MIDSKAIEATGLNIVVIRDEEKTTLNGSNIIVPDGAIIKPNSGVVISVGEKVTCASIQVGKRAFWNKNVGHEYELESEESVIVLAENQILFCG